MLLNRKCSFYDDGEYVNDNSNSCLIMLCLKLGLQQKSNEIKFGNLVFIPKVASFHLCHSMMMEMHGEPRINLVVTYNF
jgi:hypothetical protein